MEWVKFSLAMWYRATRGMSDAEKGRLMDATVDALVDGRAGESPLADSIIEENRAYLEQARENGRRGGLKRVKNAKMRKKNCAKNAQISRGGCKPLGTLEENEKTTRGENAKAAKTNEENKISRVGKAPLGTLEEKGENTPISDAVSRVPNQNKQTNKQTKKEFLPVSEELQHNAVAIQTRTHAGDDARGSDGATPEAGATPPKAGFQPGDDGAAAKERDAGRREARPIGAILPSAERMVAQPQRRRALDPVSKFVSDPKAGLGEYPPVMYAEIAAAYCGERGRNLTIRTFGVAMRSIGPKAFRRVFERFVAECECGEEPRNRAAALTAQLKGAKEAQESEARTAGAGGKEGATA